MEGRLRLPIAAAARYPPVGIDVRGAAADGMNEEVKRRAALRFGNAEWFRRFGDIAKSIGTDRFHEALVDLFGASVPHNAGWIIRYSRAAPPDVIYSWNVPAETLRIYNSKCLEIDPFSRHWKRSQSSGVLTLAQLETSDLDFLLYKSLYLGPAGVSDEMGMFFSTIGHCCLGLFLDRRAGRFEASDVRRASRMFPALEGFHRAHLERLFDNLRRKDVFGAQDFINRPVFIQDRFGIEVYSNASWSCAARSEPAIMEAVAELFPETSPQTRLAGNFVVRSETFDKDFSLAPRGRMFVLEPRPLIGEGGAERRKDVLQLFTPREGEVLLMIMQGWSTGQIAQRLEMSKGTIRNLRLRIHRKAEVASERELIKKFMPIFELT